ncbi:GGDEF domain-containing protein [Sporosarcina oncorhynchi]|uniref:GGDEF domain-containing protein n=1 Tax=Sporosarcina oncorhynchi TaxID=3056444 RepID=A0ABZ0L9R1_9BACL|nr:GGDEF domain-containing protein [Sporosarcina sp. T2O-4]WOV88219.1 GGDEF domain-containing protein [Sporosarcina sp. T2O-4]
METTDLFSLQDTVSDLRVQGKYKETIEVSFRLFELGYSAKDYKSIMVALINRATSYYCIGEIQEAFTSIDAYLEYCGDHGDDVDRLNGYNILFLVHEKNNDYVKAKATLTKTINLGKKLQHYNMVSNAYSNYSHLCSAEEDYEGALKYASKGLEMAELHEPRTPILEFRVKLNVANAYIGLGKLDCAEELIEEMRHDTLLDSFIREKTQVYDLYGRFLMKAARYEKAYNSFTKAKELAESFNDQNLLKGLLEKRCKACEQMGNVELGFLAQQDYINLLQSLHEQEVMKTAMRLELKHDLAAIERRANRDYLTGLYNRSYMEAATDEMLEKAALVGEQVSCIALDLDNLKLMNDTFGHMFGDEVIKEIANVCSGKIRSDDLMGRFGGDEFAIILKGLSPEQAKIKAEQLVEAVRRTKIEKNGKYISVSASLGIADNGNGEITTFKDLFHEADMALYEAKRNGKDQICIMA